jgi:hypothetical protein
MPEYKIRAIWRGGKAENNLDFLTPCTENVLYFALTL